MNDLFGSDDESEEDIKIDSDEVILYTEVLNMPDVGGNRGVFAVRDLPAGCLLCAEKPFTTWSPGIDFTEVDDLANVILQVVRSLPALQCTYSLHPKTVSECDEQEINEIRRLFDTYDNGDLQKLAVEANLNEEEIIRIALVLQHNGFNSGLYEKQSLFNHACAPNCIKLIPPGRHSASEIWTIREIKAGEELTICYMSPLESAHRNVRQYVEINHRFICTCTKCLQYKEENSNKEKEEGDVLYEAKIVEIENKTVEFMQTKKSHNHLEERMNTLLQSKQLLEEDSLKNVLDAPLLSRACKAIISAVHSCFQVTDTIDTTINTELAVTFLEYNLKLLSYQNQYLERSHPDIGSTMGDIAEGIATLREHFPKVLAMKFTSIHWNTVMVPVTLIQDKSSSNDTKVQSISAEESAAASLKACGIVSPDPRPTTTTTATGTATSAIPTATATQCARYCTAEARRVKSMYSTAVKYPAAMKLLTASPGSFYWGGEGSTPQP